MTAMFHFAGGECVSVPCWLFIVSCCCAKLTDGKYCYASSGHRFPSLCCLFLADRFTFLDGLVMVVMLMDCIFRSLLQPPKRSQLKRQRPRRERRDCGNFESYISNGWVVSYIIVYSSVFTKTFVCVVVSGRTQLWNTPFNTSSSSTNTCFDPDK